jgi:hypothetical protein
MSNNLKIIEIGGRQLHYVDQGEEGPSPVIIFIHGGLDDYRCWQFQIDSFSKNTVPSHTVEGLLILTNGLVTLSQIIPSRKMLKIWLN